MEGTLRPACDGARRGADPSQDWRKLPLDKYRSAVYYLSMNDLEGTESCDPYRLIEALMQSGRYTEGQLDAALVPAGLSAAKWGVLRHLAEAGGQLPLGQLATRLACVKSNATQLVDRLETDRLVRRSPDPEDRRSIRAEMTAAGQSAYESGLEIVRGFEARLLEEYQPQERVLLRRLLARLGGQENDSR